MPMYDIQPTTPRLTRLGIIRLGIKKTAKSGKEYPAEVDHFVLKDAPDLVAAYGDAPTELYIYLPFDSIDENNPAWHELWYKRGLVCRGNGKTIEKLVKSGQGIVIQDGEVIEPYQDDAQDGTQPTFEPGDIVTCPGLDRSRWTRCSQCKPTSRLYVMVRDPQRPTQLVNDRLGYYQITTSSFANVQTIVGQLMHALETAKAIGHPSLKGVPMILKRVERQMSYVDKNGQQKSSTHYLLELEFDVKWVQVANEAIHRAALGQGFVQAPALPEMVSPPPRQGQPRAMAGPDAVEGEYIEEEGGDGEPEPALTEAQMEALADLDALLDTPPDDFEAAEEVLAGFLGTAYDHRAVLLYAHNALGLARTEPMSIVWAWPHMIETVSQQLVAGWGEDDGDEPF